MPLINKVININYYLGGKMMVKKKLSMVVIALVLLFTTAFSPVAQAESKSLNKVINSITTNDGSKIELKQLNKTNTIMEFTVQGNEVNDHVVVNYDTKEFSVTDKDGNIATYNANDFVVNSGVDESVNEAPVEESFEQLATDGSKSYITDMYHALDMPTNSVMTTGTTYSNNALKVTPYTFTWNKQTTAPRKLSWGVGTSLSVITAALVAFIPAINLSAVTSFVVSMGITIFNSTIQTVFAPTVSTHSYYKGRVFYVHGKGNTVKTRSWSNYIESNKKDGTKVSTLYSTDGYAYWYNGRIDSQVADIAYQQYRYIDGLRGSPPYGQEFSWY